MSRRRKTVADYEAEAKWVGGCLVSKWGAHARKVYILRHGPLTSKQYVCHECDTVGCILDKHHFLGSAKDNIQDSVRKGRHSCFRKGGARFTGRHTAEARKKISKASKKMWRRRREAA